MSVKVNIATNGLIGAVTSNAASLSVSNNNEVLAPNTVYVLTGNSDFQVNLPAPDAGIELAGAVVVMKMLTTGDPTITIGTETLDTFIDGGTVDVELDTDGQTISFYYIDTTNGWITGPATL